MSAYHPILRDLRSDISELKNSCRTVKKNQKDVLKVVDTNPKLVAFCKSLEIAFKHGLLNPSGICYLLSSVPKVHA